MLSYLGIRKLTRTFEREGKVQPAVWEIISKLPEEQRLAKAKELWADEEFVEREFAKANEEKNPGYAVLFYLIWGALAIWGLCALSSYLRSGGNG